MSATELEDRGFVLLSNGPSGINLSTVRRHVEAMNDEEAGTRELLSHEWCRALVGPLKKSLARHDISTRGLVAVQCTLFHKSAGRNWKVALHQDLSIPVAARIRRDGMLGWSEKEGRHYVQPPADLTRQMLAVRLHLDPSLESDGPLAVVPGSHRNGRLTAADAIGMEGRCGRVTCIANEGDILVMRPLCLHASSKASGARAIRRMLHFVFGPSEPGFGLQWSGTA